jgi:protein disulfide isomerase
MKKTGPSSTEVTCDQLRERATGKLNLAYFGDLSGYDFEAFMAASRQPAISEDFEFFHTADKECAAHFKTSAPGIALIRTFDDSPLSYVATDGEPMAVSDIVSFAVGNSVPTLITFSEDYIDPIFGKRNPALMLFANDDDAAYSKVFAEAAQAFKGKILFVKSGATEGIQQKLAEFVGVTKDMLPTLRLIEPSETGIRKFRYDADINALSVEAVGAWADDFKNGKLSPFLKSEEIPEVQEGAVHVVVGKSFDQVVKDPSKDVLVKFYAPWCGHCKKLAPVWDELAEHYANNQDLVIAKFDATANEVDGVDIRSYPTLIFYPKDNKAGINYDGGRELDDFKAWLAENSSAVKAQGEQHDEL